MNQSTISTLISIEADASNNLPERLHLLRVGKFETEKYGTLEVTADDLQEFVKNYEAGYGRNGADGQKGGLPVNFGHDKGGKAAAWIYGLEADENGDLWGTNIKWSKAGKESVEGHEYKFLSSEFTPRCLGGLWRNSENATQKIRNVFTGAALTNIPMFSGNKQVMASTASDSEGDKQIIYINATQKEQTSMNLDSLRVKNAADLTAEEKQFVEAHKSELSADEKTKFGIVEASTEVTEVKTVDASAVTGTEGVVSIDASQLKAINDERAELKKTVEAHAEVLNGFKQKEVEASVKTHLERGAIKADQVEKWSKAVMADASAMELLEALPDNAKMAEEIGRDNGSGAAVSASEEVDTKAKELMKTNTNLSLGEAYSEVFASNSELAERYNQETING